MNDVTIVGIDLGTTKSALALWSAQTGAVQIIPNAEGQQVTASVVQIDPASGATTVGTAALARLSSTPAEVIYSVKRFIGRTFRDPWVQHDQEQMTYTIERGPNDKVLIRVGEHLLTPPDISGAVLRKLKDDAQARLGFAITQAVITVPAYFNESQRMATKEAGERAGLRVPRIINEPTAAALAFGLGASQQTVAVYDLGGGTFDISILEINQGVFRVKATGGDTHLGGNDFDSAIVTWLAAGFQHQHGLALALDDDRLRARLREAAEHAKVALSTEDSIPITVAAVAEAAGQPLDLHTTLSRAQLETLIMPLIDKTLAICDSTLASAKLTKPSIAQVLLVGSPTRMPMLKAKIANHFGCPTNDTVPPDQAVARGAAILGARLCGYLQDQVRLWDVIPLTLGLELHDGRMDPIFAANTQIPISIWRRDLTTSRDGQMRITLRIYQGERPVAAQNALVGELALELTTARPAQVPRIHCKFMIDQDGILHVYAEDAETEGVALEAHFDHEYALSDDEVAKLRAAASQHAAEDEKTRQLFALRDELAHQRRSAGTSRPPGDPLLLLLDEFAAAIDAGNPEAAERLLHAVRAIR